MNPLLRYTAALAATAACFPALGVPKPKPANIIVVFIDDMGYGDLGCYGAIGSTTPNLDKMASQGCVLPTSSRLKLFAAHHGQGS